MTDIYEIQSGDSLNSIADRFNTTVEELLKENNIQYPAELRVGMKLIIPSNEEKYFSIYTIENGDSLYKISQKYNINPELLAALNGINMDDYIYPNQELLIPKKGYSYYLTAEGDTLKMVSDMFKTSNEKVLKENETIYLLPGQLLVNRK